MKKQLSGSLCHIRVKFARPYILPILRATLFLRKSKFSRSQISYRNLILSGMSAPSMQLFDTWYFLFSLAHSMSSEIGLQLHVAGVFESLESGGNSLEDICYGQKPGYYLGRFSGRFFKRRHVHSYTRSTFPIILSLCIIQKECTFVFCASINSQRYYLDVQPKDKQPTKVM